MRTSINFIDPDSLIWDFVLFERVLTYPSIVKSITRDGCRYTVTRVLYLLNHIVSRLTEVTDNVRLFFFPLAVLRRLPWSVARKLRR